MKNIVLIGCGGHAKSIIDIIEGLDIWKIFGLIGLKEEIGKETLGYKCIGCDSDLNEIYSYCKNAFISIGQINNVQKRVLVGETLNKYNFNIPRIFSKNSYISKHAEINYGTSIGHGTIVNAGSKIGCNCIVNSNALIEHDVKIGDYCHISTGTIINGQVEIGEGSFIGSGTIIREGLKIPPYSIISAGERIMGWPLKREDL